jgi:hypothetical protein
VRNAITNPYSDAYRDAKTHANSDCYGHRDFDTCAKSYSYTKGAPESAAPTVVSSMISR